ncbi:ceramidase [Halteromyces radiatus]|uniref:ceramidase n=1 Tax=Halteromyces radiatus TaxID=101107 RepID=UPI002220C70F|nr:ceramidase [Halteromyces radiatus]KAI8081392.1 ceramidase [Halteromyces radiatus]
MDSIPQDKYFWGPATATIDWCEENYALSPYLAEFINTTTNLSFAFLSLFGMYKSLQNGCSKSFILAHLGVLLVGFGSWCFHMTLQYEMQLLDELPMIYVGCIMVYFSVEVYSKAKYGISLVLFLMGYSAFVTYSYLIINDPVFHQVAYALLVITIVFRSVYIVRHLDRTTYQYEHPRLVRLLKLAAAGFILAFGIWNVDNQFCSYLRHFRTTVPYALGALSQLHGWWHIGTSLGVYYFTVYVEWICKILDDTIKQKYELVWIGFICYLRPVKSHQQ